MKRKTLRDFTVGGKVRGPGTATSDSILARLSNGEYVLPKKAVDMVGVPALEAIRRTALKVQPPRLALGGPIREQGESTGLDDPRFAPNKPGSLLRNPIYPTLPIIPSASTPNPGPTNLLRQPFPSMETLPTGGMGTPSIRKPDLSSIRGFAGGGPISKLTNRAAKYLVERPEAAAKIGKTIEKVVRNAAFDQVIGMAPGVAGFVHGMTYSPPAHTSTLYPAWDQDAEKARAAIRAGRGDEPSNGFFGLKGILAGPTPREKLAEYQQAQIDIDNQMRKFGMTAPSDRKALEAMNQFNPRAYHGVGPMGYAVGGPVLDANKMSDDQLLQMANMGRKNADYTVKAGALPSGYDAFIQQQNIQNEARNRGLISYAEGGVVTRSPKRAKRGKPKKSALPRFAEGGAAAGSGAKKSTDPNAAKKNKNSLLPDQNNPNSMTNSQATSLSALATMPASIGPVKTEGQIAGEANQLSEANNPTTTAPTTSPTGNDLTLTNRMNAGADLLRRLREESAANATVTAGSIRSEVPDLPPAQLPELPPPPQPSASKPFISKKAEPPPAPMPSYVRTPITSRISEAAEADPSRLVLPNTNDRYSGLTNVVYPTLGILPRFAEGGVALTARQWHALPGYAEGTKPEDQNQQNPEPGLWQQFLQAIHEPPPDPIQSSSFQRPEHGIVKQQQLKQQQLANPRIHFYGDIPLYNDGIPYMVENIPNPVTGKLPQQSINIDQTKYQAFLPINKSKLSGLASARALTDNLEAVRNIQQNAPSWETMREPSALPRTILAHQPPADHRPQPSLLYAPGAREAASYAQSMGGGEILRNGPGDGVGQQLVVVTPSRQVGTQRYSTGEPFEPSQGAAIPPPFMGERRLMEGSGVTGPITLGGSDRPIYETQYTIFGPSGKKGSMTFTGPSRRVGGGTVSQPDQGNGGTVEGNVAALERQYQAIKSLNDAYANERGSSGVAGIDYNDLMRRSDPFYAPGQGFGDEVMARDRYLRGLPRGNKPHEIALRNKVYEGLAEIQQNRFAKLAGLALHEQNQQNDRRNQEINLQRLQQNAALADANRQRQAEADYYRYLNDQAKEDRLARYQDRILQQNEDRLAQQAALKYGDLATEIYKKKMELNKPVTPLSVTDAANALKNYYVEDLKSGVPVLNRDRFHADFGIVPMTDKTKPAPGKTYFNPQDNSYWLAMKDGKLQPFSGIMDILQYQHLLNQGL